jgi:adenylosuccinate synthase
MTPVVVCGLGFGDEGKGTVTDLFARRLGADAVVRWNGGPQAGHNVIAPDGRWHCFAQVGAGSFAGARTLLAPGMIVELEALAVELEVLAAKGVRPRVTIDPDCTLVTPMHKLVGQLEELARGADRRGTCGMGVGEAARGRARGDDIRVRDVLAGGARDRLAALAETCWDRARAFRATDEQDAVHAHFHVRCDPDALARRYREVLAGVEVAPVVARGAIVFEGAQGALLDGRRGFVPYVTQSRTTFHGALELADVRALRVGVLRAYAHRHGPGPLVTEDARLADRLADPHNPDNRWQGRFRTGPLDLVALRHGLALNGGADQLALTGLDRLAGLGPVRLCTGYDYTGDLAALDAHFAWQRTGADRARISAVRTPPVDAVLDGERAALLLRCRPGAWLELPGWDAPLAEARALADLPAAARRLLDVLADELGVPIGVVSIGPGAEQKIVSRS